MCTCMHAFVRVNVCAHVCARVCMCVCGCSPICSCRGVDSDLILKLWAQRIAPELTVDEDGNDLPVPK